MPQEKLSALPPDLYSRNTLIVFLINKIINKPEFRILDVGGRDGRLNDFLHPSCKYTVFDKQQASTPVNHAYIVGDARKIPYSDRNFDAVVASDVLEHVHSADRERVLGEMLRVSKNVLILGSPFKNKLVETAEKNVCEHYLKNSGTQHPFLSEHESFGLPDEESFDNLLKKKGCSFFKVREGNLMNWYIQQLYSSTKCGEITSKESVKFNRFFNDHLYELGNLRVPTYRTIYCITKEGTLPEAKIMEELQGKHTWNPEVFMDLLKTAFEDLRLLMDKRKDQITLLSEEIAGKENEFARVRKQHEDTLGIARKSVEAHRQAIIELRNFLGEKEKALGYLKTMLVAKITKLETIEKEYKVVESALKEKDNMITRIREEKEKITSSAENSLNLLAGKDAQLEAIKEELNSHRDELLKVRDSRAWKAVLMYGRVKKVLLVDSLNFIKKGWKIMMVLGPSVFFKRLFNKVKPDIALPQMKVPYDLYLEKNALTEKNIGDIRMKIKKLTYQPVISIVMPVYDIEEKWLVKAIESVKEQLYSRWELCICDDASTLPHVRLLLEKYAAADKRIRVAWHRQNGGIVKASNTALGLATGAYVGFLDNDDELTKDALFEVVKALQSVRYDLVYSDEDKIDLKGKLVEPFFKPDWSPDLLLSSNYICHFAVYRKNLLTDIGGLREGYEGSQDYDLVLRFTEKTDKIKHIPKVLYHWRKITGSTAAEADAKPYAFEAAKKALKDAMRRRNEEAEVTSGIWLGSYRIQRSIKRMPLISVIIPFRDKPEILKKCLESIFSRTTYFNYEILLIDNQSSEPQTLDYLKSLEGNDRIRVFSYDKPFNFSAINNFAAEQARGEILLLLNNDMEVITPDWMQSMLEHALRPEVGAVGAKLIYPNGMIQHAGVVIGLNGIANHAFCQVMSDDPGYFGQAGLIRNYSAVTGACLMIRKEIYLKVGGLNENELAVAFNDVDLCLKLRENGYLIVYTPYASLYHHESLSRGYDVNLKEVAYMQDRYSKQLSSADYYYNPNLTHERFDFSLRVMDKNS